MEDIIFNDEEKYFGINISGREYHFNYPLEVKKGFEGENFELFLFYKNNYVENNIFTVRLKKDNKRLGMLFPITSLTSLSHEYVDKDFFQKYAFVAYKYLIRLSKVNNLYVNTSSGELLLEDIFSDDILVCILAKDNLETADISDFKIDNFLPSFYLHGLVLYDFDHKDNYKQDLKDLPSTSNLLIEETSNTLLMEPFISNIFKKILPFTNEYIVDFFYSYQIVELLLDAIFKNEVKSLVDIVNGDMTNSRNIIDVLHEVRETTSEKSRILKLENEYMVSRYLDESFHYECNKILKKYGKKEGDSLNQFFYGTRNLLFHELRSIDDIEELKPIIIEFNYFIAHLVINFMLIENAVALEEDEEDNIEFSRREKIFNGLKLFCRSFVD